MLTFVVSQMLSIILTITKFTADVQYVVTNGELPNEADQNYTHLNGADGRGSCVWFNQASMFQTAELGYGTVGKARKAGVDVNCDTEVLLKAEHFPSSS